MQTINSQSASDLRLPVSRLNGSPEVSPTWLATHVGEVRLVDVREPHELRGPLRAIDDAVNVPLANLLADGVEADPSEAVVLVCRSGRRSATAAAELERRGYGRVASVEGGMLAWNAEVRGLAMIVEDERRANAANLEGAIDRTNGLPEVSARWVGQNLGRFRLVDVREVAEREGPMGLIPQAEHVPLARLMAAAKDWPREAPVVIHCASGGRSARAALALEGAGFRKVASMEGGMIAWRTQGHA